MNILPSISWKHILCIILLVFGITRLEAKDYKGAELRTIQTFKYGRFEASIKASAGSGQLCSFFTYYDGGGVSNWNEIDIEILGRYTDDVQFNTITPGESHHVSHHPVFSNTQNDFHTYGFEWTPDYVAWFIDGEEVRRQKGDHIETLNKRQKIMMNIWLPDYYGWVDQWDPAILPVRAYYDWVSYSSYTPGEGNTGTDNNFSHQWTDEFTAWNTSRWAKAYHTWTGNNCDFTPDNVVFFSGCMMLCLTDSEHLGYNDPNPPLFQWARASEGKVTVSFSEEIEETSAEDVENYIIPQVTLNQAILLEGNRSVELSVSGMDLEDSHKIFVSGIADLASPPNTMSLSAFDIFMPEPIEFPVKINIAGSTYNDFLPDQEWNESVEYGYVGGSRSQYPQYPPIDGTEDDEIYQSEQWGLLSYKIRGPSGRYSITLMMAENYFNESGKRLFDIF